MIRKSNKELSEQVRASMFAKTHQAHDELHHRELSEKGELNQRAKKDIESWMRKSMRF